MTCHGQFEILDLMSFGQFWNIYTHNNQASKSREWSIIKTLFYNSDVIQFGIGVFFWLHIYTNPTSAVTTAHYAIKVKVLFIYF